MLLFVALTLEKMWKEFVGEFKSTDDKKNIYNVARLNLGSM